MKTNQPGRIGPIPFTIPLTGLDANGQATDDQRAARGQSRTPARNTVIPVGDRFFGAPNLRVQQGSCLTWQFNGQELHNVTLANGPLGIGTDNLDGGRTFTEKLNRPGHLPLLLRAASGADAGAGDRHRPRRKHSKKR